MIKINRIAKPAILNKQEALWLIAIKNAKNKKELDKAVNRYQHNKIKEALTRMFCGKCAFCESYIENVDYGDIEHFKPKSKFPLEAVVWNNLLLSCKKCNGAGQKGDAWPTDAEGGPLVNPCDEEPNDFFSFEFDQETNISLVIPKNIRGQTAEKIYGLNKLTLVKDRNNKIKMLIALARYYHSDENAKQLLDEAAKDDNEYSAFAKMILTKYI